MATKTAAPALTRFLDIWGRDLAPDLAERLTCPEAEAIAELFRACGHTEQAAAWIDHHSRADEEGDLHYQGGASA